MINHVFYCYKIVTSLNNTEMFLYDDTSLIAIWKRADAQGNDMNERLQARIISPGKHARSKSQD